MIDKALRAAATLLLACVPLTAGATDPANTNPTSAGADGANGVIEHSESWDVAPRFKRGTVPVFPLSYVHKRKPGSAVITYTVTDKGKAMDVIIVHASDPAFGGHVAEAIRRWSHYPATKDGKPVTATVTREFALTID